MLALVGFPIAFAPTILLVFRSHPPKANSWNLSIVKAILKNLLLTWNPLLRKSLQSTAALAPGAATVILYMTAGPAQAVDKTRAENSNLLSVDAAWSGGVPVSVDKTIWDSLVSATNATRNLGGNASWGQIVIKDPAGNVTFCANGTHSFTLAGIDGAGNVGVVSIGRTAVTCDLPIGWGWSCSSCCAAFETIPSSGLWTFSGLTARQLAGRLVVPLFSIFKQA